MLMVQILQSKDTSWQIVLIKIWSTVCCLKEIHLSDKDKHRKVKGWEKISHEKGTPNKVGVTMYISDTVDLKQKLIRRGKEENFILIKVTIHEKIVTIPNIYAPNICTHHYIKQILQT
jgi:exonuclease III